MKIKLVSDKVLKNKYWGMNHFAGKHLGFKVPKNTILVSKSASKLMRKKTIAHEKIESFQMSRGLNYKKSDKIASSFDKNIR